MSYLNKNYLLSISYKCLIILSTLKGAKSDAQSPCPNVFTYEYDNKSQVVGLIKAPVSYNDYNQGTIRLDVEMSVGNAVQGYSGSLQLATPESRIREDIGQNQPLLYRVRFPHWDKILPAITKILLNENQICHGNPIDKTLVPIVTTIHLHHTLSINAPQNIESQKNAELFPSYINPTIESRFQIPLPNFNPQPPNNPSKLYPHNPFLNQTNILNAFDKFVNTIKENITGNNFSYNATLRALFVYTYLPESSSLEPNYLNNFTFFFDSAKSAPSDGNTPEISLPSRGQFTPLLTESPVINNNAITNFAPTQEPIEFVSNTNLAQKPFSNECGIPVRTNSLLVNGNPVSKELHPWLAAIFKQSEKGLEYTCGSTLISQKHVITAAHCTHHNSIQIKAEELWVVLGRKNIQRWSSIGSQTIQAESIQIHPDYVSKKPDADIAIITLTEEVVFSNLIRPACLWNGDTDVKLILDKIGTVVGWGKDETGKFYSPEPKQFDFPVVSQEDCVRSNPALMEVTSSRTFCAGYRNNTGPCNGDSGNGFLMRVDGRWTLRGIVSTSLLRDSDISCDLDEYVVYTDVAQFEAWVSYSIQ